MNTSPVSGVIVILPFAVVASINTVDDATVDLTCILPE